MKETLDTARAFEYWARISEGRSGNPVLDKVAKAFHRTGRTIRRWHTEFDWRERYDEIVKEVGELQREQTVQILLKTRQDYREIIAEGIDQFKANLRRQKVQLTQVRDFEILAKLDLIMQGESTGDETKIVIITAIPRPVEVAHEDDEEPLTIHNALSEHTKSIEEVT